MSTNLNQAQRMYTPQYKSLLKAVMEAQEAFKDAQAPLQILDGVSFNKKAFTVKTSGTKVVVGEYNTDANIDGSDGSRFGAVTEIKYLDEDVEYSYVLSTNEGIDRTTLNQDEQQAIADRTDVNAQEHVRIKNKYMGKYLSENASETKTLAKMEADDVIKLFNEMSALFTNREVRAKLLAYVTPELFNALVDMITFKAISGASVDPNNNKVVNWKGFTIKEEAAQYFADGDVAYFMAEKIILPFVGIDVARTMESQDFNGVLFQTLAKGGHHVLEDNKQALVKATMQAPKQVSAKGGKKKDDDGANADGTPEGNEGK